MAENRDASEMPNRNDCSETYDEYLNQAVSACESGDLVLGMHLYLAAYEAAAANPSAIDGRALSGLREAWNLACDLKERSMAEYVFEKLEPYLTGEEIAACAGKLQSLALDRLEEYGFSREDLEDMAEMISQDFIGADGSVIKVESISIPHAGLLESASHSADVVLDVEIGAPAPDAAGGPGDGQRFEPQASTEPDGGEREDAAPVPALRDDAQTGDVRARSTRECGLGVADVDDFNPYDMYRDYSIGKSYHSATNEGSGSHIFTRDAERAEAHRQYCESSAQPQESTEQGGQNPAPAGSDANQVEGAVASGGGNGQSKTVQPGTPAAAPASPGQTVASGAEQAAGARPSPAQKPPSPSESAPGFLQKPGAPKGEDSGAGKTGIRLAAQSVKPAGAATSEPAHDRLNFKSLAGYDRTISVMRDLGIGMQNDKSFRDFVALLNERHGLTRAPSLDTLLFRAPVVEDAARFVEAVIGELGLPVLRMEMEESIQGMPVLCVMTQGNNRPRMNHAQNKFEGPAILVIDNLDVWSMPEPPENMEGIGGIGGFVMANISRGAREAVNLIHSAVEDPDVYVFATSSTESEADPFFYDLLEPMTIVDISNPDEKERDDIWAEIAHDHPSMRAVNRVDLMRLSVGMPRYDMYMAAREAIEEAYKIGLMSRSYVAVSPQNIFEKLAAYQPYESVEYQALEDEVVRNFRSELDNLDDLIGGQRD